ncbi:MAG: hypothetical protein WC180_06265 [Candidatus Paceibacterota bacterium]
MPADLTVVCVPCKARYEQSITNLLKINKKLEAELAELQTKPDRRDELIGMIAPDIIRSAKIKNLDQRIYDICDLYNEIYPEGVK